MSRTPIAVQLYSVREDSAKDFPATIKAVAELGYEAVEFAGYHGLSAQEIKTILDDLGIKAAGTHTGLGTIQGDELAKTAEFNLTFGNPHLIVPGVGGEFRGTREGALRLAEELTTAAARAKELGAFVGYHNHDWEFKEVDGGSFALQILAENTPEEVVLQVDTGNAQDAGFDPLPFLKQWQSRLALVHLKPHAANFENYFVGEDDSDWEGIFAALEGAPTKYYIVEQERYPEPNTPLQCIDRCLKNLKKLGK
jgi:sugar phosphate isomerase/epimerase